MRLRLVLEPVICGAGSYAPPRKTGDNLQEQPGEPGETPRPYREAEAPPDDSPLAE